MQHGEHSVAVIGCGHWGTNIVRTLDSLGALRGVVDHDHARANAGARRHGVPAMTIDEVLGDLSISAVAIATPASTHYELTRRCLLAGKDTFVEKPMALDRHQGQSLVELASSLDRILMVGHLLQYHSGFQRLMEVIDRGDLGRLRYVYSNRLNFGKIRREEDILWSFAPHDLSMILRIAGEEPNHVSCFGTFTLDQQVADVTTTHLGFESGLEAHVFVTWIHPSKEQRLVVIGDRAMAVLDDVLPWAEKLAVYRGQVEWRGGIPVAPSVSPEFVALEEKEPLRTEMRHFLDCTAARTTPLTDGIEGLRVLGVLDAATRDLLAQQRTKRQPVSSTSASVHETAVVDEHVEIGEGTKVWHFSHVLKGSSVGANCSLGQNVVVGPNVRIGNGCKIQNNVSVYDGVELEDDVFCGPSMVFTNVARPRAFIDRRSEFVRTLVKRGASIGANATIVCGSTIGDYALIGAGAVVTGDVHPHALMQGVPARRVGWVSRSGEVLGESLRCPLSGERYELVGDALRLVGGT